MPANRLDTETSPYLLQHKGNPVHWWAWGEEALAEAKRTGKPILLSVGYAACHWCHVMAHESFEDETTADVMNELYVNIKVDREERPDIDAIYMAALHTLGEQGGWPLTMFLSPDAEPFWGGTYFPKDERYGKPSFVRVLREVARIHRNEPARVAQNSSAILERLRASAPSEQAPRIGEAALRDLAARAATLVDPVHGGMEGAPKFPQYSFFWFLWRTGIRYDLENARVAAQTTLDHICQGGIYDHLAGGFSRYSVDERWLVPHFEKMLYDNALLIDLMTEVWKQTGSPLLEQRIAETIGFVLSDMAAPEGGFAASWDADSEGEEGKFYLWSRSEIDQVLGAEDAALFATHYDVTAAGNFEGHNILNRLGSLRLAAGEIEARLASMRARLRQHRAKRIPPGYDDKVLADWNGLMIAALAKASTAFEQPRWLSAALGAYKLVVGRMQKGGRLIHSYRAGEGKAPATASDYANMIGAAIALHEATGEAGYVADARRWAGVLDRHYWLDDRGGYAFTADDTASLIVRTRTAHDDATPNANGVMVSNLVKLQMLTGEASYEDRAKATLEAFAPELARGPLACTGLMTGLIDLESPQQLVIVRGAASGLGPLERAARTLALPGALVQVIDDPALIAPSSAAAGKKAIGGKTTAYLCVGRTCSSPMTEAHELAETARALRRANVKQP